MNRLFYLQIMVLAVFISLMGSYNSYGQDSRQKLIQTNEQNMISNDILPNFQGDSKIVTKYTPTNPLVVLYDQTAGTTTSGIASQDFETANNVYDCQAADDFTVPAGGWTIRQVIVGGFYSTTGPAAGFNIYFYPNTAGVPGATPVYSALAQPYSYDGSYFTIQLNTDAVLAPGTYWLSVQCRMDFGTGGQWYWFTSTGTFGNVAQWQNPGGGFAVCPTWGAITTCNAATQTELSFALTDEVPPPPSLPVVADFEDGIFPPMNWSLSAGALWKSSGYYVQSSGASGYGVGQYSALADFYVVYPATQDLITLEYNSAGASNPTLTFDWAYATYSGEVDEMDIYYSTDAGATWVILLAMPGGISGILNPYNIVDTAPYFPEDNEWSTMSLPLPAGTNKVKFTAISDNGNWLFLDNIGISDQFFDNFDSYTAGLRLCGQTTDWQTWSGGTGTAEDPFVSSTYSYSPTNSVKIAQNNDLVRVNGPKTSGVWYMSWMTYIPTGKVGYFNALADFAGAASVWGMQAFFEAGGTGYIDAGGAASATFFYPYDDWFQVWLKVDLDADLATLRINGSLVHTWQYTLGTFGTPILLQLDANNFYGASVNDEMYIDNYYFSAIAPPIQLLPADAGMVSIDLGIAIAPGSPSPQATVRNFGGETQTFPVTMTIGTYTSTKTVTNLAPDATAQVTFDPWTAVTGGPLTVNVCTELTGDLNNANNCSSQPLYVWDDSGTWTAGANYPTTTFLGTGTSWIETTADATVGHLFSLGGVDPGSITTAACYEYNVNTNTWTAIASMPADRDRFASATVGDFIIAMGGYPEAVTVPQGTVWKYDINANLWSTVAPLPTGEERGWHKAVSYNDNYVYVAGGITGDIGGTAFEYESSVLVYNVTTNTWATASSMPGARFGGAFAISGNQLVYIGGASPDGIANTVFVGTIDAGNPTIINWTTELQMFPGAQNKSYLEYSANLIESINTKTNPKDQSRLVGGAPAGALYRFDAATWGTDGVIVTTGAPGGFVPADPNYCFVYYPGTDTWLAQENLPTPVVGSSFGTVNDGNTWKLIVAAGSDGAVGLNTTQIYTQTLGGASTFQLTVNVANGWNMVSIPGLHPVDQNVNTWWAFKEPGSLVYRYQGGYQSVTDAAPGLGYWMKHAGALTYNTGEEWPAGGINIVPHVPLTGASGWNMIGGYELIVQTANVTTNPPGLQSGLIYGYSGGYQTATTLNPGKGYWIKLTGAGQIIIPEAMAKEGNPIEYFAEDWGRIILTDAAGVSYTLYAVKGEVDLSQYELPPAPMEGMYDFRFTSGRIAEDINSSMKTIDMSGVIYPLTVRVEGMDMKIMDESGKMINTNLKSGEDIVIENATIRKLMVSGELLPTVYALEQNYPNPFNPSTVIEFSLPEDVANVKLSIYNALGEKVAELVNTSLTAGKYQYQWNAQNVATGMYIYELRADKFVSVKKMLLLK